MKAYFSATITKDEKIKKRYANIVKALKKGGVEVSQYGSDKMSPHELLNRTDQEIGDVYKELVSYLKSADVYIAEISEPSVGIGYEINEAINLKKPVLALNHKESAFQPLATIQGLQSRFITYKEYTDDTIEEILEEFLKAAKDKIDTKFILIISPEIDRYLEWAADFKRMHKAQIVRSSVEQEMENDEDYQKYLKERE